MLVKIYSSAVNGINALPVTIEVNILNGAKFIIVGLPDNAIKESQQRVDSALRQIGSRIPGKRIIINLAPADVKKEGSAYDLPIAIGILLANEELPLQDFREFVFTGELSLDGSLVPVKGVLPIAVNAFENGFKNMIVPLSNANEAAVVKGLHVYGFSHLREVVDFLKNPQPITPVIFNMNETGEMPADFSFFDFKDVKGQENVKRSMEIAAAGSHNLLIIGPPGSGKTMLSRRLPGILPPMTLEESLETTKIHSVAGKLPPHVSLITTRPFRAPHHTISDIALIGGGNYPLPGEISLACNGVLYLDELPEFKRNVLEVMRQPLEDRKITISRARSSVEYPANFMLIASMNPCPCGYYNHPTKECTCPPGAVRKYLSRISGPLLDRIDMHIEVVPVELDKMTSANETESSSCIRERVIRARRIQTERFKEYAGIYCNAQMTPTLLKKYCPLDSACLTLLKTAMQKFGLSARAYDRIIKLSRTIADLEDTAVIQPHHIAEAIQYRSLDKDCWGR
ncbi:YifB family Mg chelatase-like AAA ATPase [Odoribacter lunatus]|uniref:YifB family Mg chelatase-like AAA ATPase n=1 Tax=Odoribacter lunatus TaxID=2941335 RepID=UPI00203FD8C7|nr:YifB family Mg chelatase-like AAA ATPase [Odoribacter lunatus]